MYERLTDEQMRSPVVRRRQCGEFVSANQPRSVRLFVVVGFENYVTGCDGNEKNHTD